MTEPKPKLGCFFIGFMMIPCVKIEVFLQLMADKTLGAISFDISSDCLLVPQPYLIIRAAPAPFGSGPVHSNLGGFSTGKLPSMVTCVEFDSRQSPLRTAWAFSYSYEDGCTLR